MANDRGFEKKLVFEFYYSEFFKNIDAFSGTSELIKKLSEYAVQYAISKRPTEIYEITKIQFKKNNILINDNNILLTNEYNRDKGEKTNKVQLAKELGINIFFEDDYLGAKTLANTINELNVILLERPHNSRQIELDRKRPQNMHIIRLSGENYINQLEEAENLVFKLMRKNE